MSISRIQIQWCRPVCSYPAYRSDQKIPLMESNFDGYHIDHLHKRTLPKLGKIVHQSHCQTQGYRIKVETEYRSDPNKTSRVLITETLFPGLMTTATPDGLLNLVACSPIDDEHSWCIIRYYMRSLYRPFFGKILKPFSYLHSFDCFA